MKGRVIIFWSLSELVMVRVQYRLYNEKHPRATKRNLLWE